MVSEEKVSREKFTDDKLLKLIKYNEKHIYSLAKKFFYFTYLDNEDLMQEGRIIIIELVKKWESGELNISEEELNKYIGTSLINCFIDLVRRYPSNNILFDPLYLDIFWTSEEEHLTKYVESTSILDERLDIIYILGMLKNMLNDQEFEVASYFLYDYSRKQIAEKMGLGIKRIDAIKAQIKKKLRVQ